MIYIIGIFTAFFLALIIFTKKGRNFADTLLGMWMIVIGFHLMLYYLHVAGLSYEYPLLLGTNVPIPFLHGMFLYFYVKALTQEDYFESRRWMIHLVLPIFIILLHIPFYTKSNAEKIAIFENEGKGYEWLSQISNILLSVSGILYIYITHKLLLAHKKRILNQFSNQEKINLNWIRLLSYIMAFMWVLIIVIKDDKIIFTASSIFVILIGYFGIKQVGIFTNQNNVIFDKTTKLDYQDQPTDIIETINENLFEERENNEVVVEKKKYAKSGLNEETALELHGRLKMLINSERCYLEPELTISDLANRLDTHPNYLSQVINDLEGINFYDYINGLRIEEFKRIVVIEENQKYTLLALAFQCGFNSKSAFNRCFKKVMGMSPSDYMKQNQSK